MSEAVNPQENAPLRVFAHGGGVQSTAALVLSAQGKIDFPVHLFCNVGDDSEHPDTLAYVHDVSMPYAKEHGIELVELHNTLRGAAITLLGLTMRPDRRSLPIPLRGSRTGAPGTRSCTRDFKVDVIKKWVKAHGATKDTPAIVGIGISLDEIERAGRGGDRDYERRVYPLLDLGLKRQDCLALVERAGLPTPPKSSCFFCPFHRTAVWAEMRRDTPELFDRACAIEAAINAKRATQGGEPMYLTRFGKPLRDAIGPAQDMLPIFDSGMDDGECDEGVCFV